MLSWFLPAHKSKESKPPADTVSKLIQKSSKFPRKFPIEQVRCEQLLKDEFPRETLERNINSTYPVIHEQALFLCTNFLNHQKKLGNREFYKNFTLIDFIDRLLSKRAVAFCGRDDYYLLLDGTEGAGGWEAVGTTEEKPPLCLANCLSYDEMKLSAFLSISSHTVFINDGNRYNRGVLEENRGLLEEDGVIIGLIGPRLHKRHFMEYQEVMKTKEQNRIGQTFVATVQGIFLNFYGAACLTFDQLLPEMSENPRYVELYKDCYFDTLVYRRRLILSIDTLLIEANDRALKQNKQAYVHVVGLGLGVWKIYQGQDKLFVETFLDRVKFLSDTLTNVSDLCFAYISHKEASDVGKIKVHVEDKSPHVRLTGDDRGKLLVVSYAWDGNALPGNEFWWGNLHSSSDPAAACSTQVAELHNWHINDRVRGENLRVATLKGLVTFEEYQKMHSHD